MKEGTLNKKCIICGSPCSRKYCEACAEKAKKEYQKEYHKGKRRLKYTGCNEDCLNCPYPDCLKPANEIKATRNITKIPRCDGISSGESQGRMFTLELGGYGGATPNISRKFYV